MGLSEGTDLASAGAALRLLRLLRRQMAKVNLAVNEAASSPRSPSSLALRNKPASPVTIPVGRRTIFIIIQEWSMSLAARMHYAAAWCPKRSDLVEKKTATSRKFQTGFRVLDIVVRPGDIWSTWKNVNVKFCFRTTRNESGPGRALGRESYYMRPFASS